MSTFAEAARLTALADGSVFVEVAPSQEGLTLYKVSGPNQIQKLGDSPRPIRTMTVSRDMKRAVTLERDYRADAWLNRVVKH